MPRLARADAGANVLGRRQSCTRRHDLTLAHEDLRFAGMCERETGIELVFTGVSPEEQFKKVLQDVTTQVCIDQLPAPTAVRTQAQFLQRWGIDALVEEGRDAWQAASARPDLEALRMRSRISEAESLLDPAGLGSFEVLEWRVG